MSRSVVLAQLAGILDSPQFRTSKRCSHFLRYVVESACDGHLERLKERVLGVEVFERDPHYDTNQDPVVRTTAGEVRKRLAQYYQEPGRALELRIGLPAGSYVPEVHPPAAEGVEPARPVVGRRVWAWGAAVAIVAVAAGVVWVAAQQVGQSPLDRFWAPLIGPERNVLVCIGQPKAYHFSVAPQAELDRWFEQTPDQRGQPPRANVLLSDVVPAWDWYVSVEDAQAFARISSLFSQRHANAELRGARSVSLADLRGRPVVLIGGYNNDWTLALAGELRYYFDVASGPNGSGQVVRDRQSPGDVLWQGGKSWPRRKIDEDYAIITRVQNKTTEQAIVIAAGITRYGTQAAAEFLTNEQYFAEALAAAPPDWHSRNMQTVVSVKVMSGTAGPPKVVAVHFW